MNSDIGIGYAQYPTGCGSGVPCQVPPGSASINNYAIAARWAINPATYQGLRVSALWDINADWNVLVTQS